MNLSQELLHEIQRKLAWMRLSQNFEHPLQVSSERLIRLATRWRLLDHFEIDDETVPTLAHFGHAEAVMWLYAHGYYRKPHTKTVMYEVDWSYYPIDMAAANGHLELVQWLYHQGEGITTFAMDYAAMNGHLHVVAWLHAHGGACTTIAFDATAGAGNLQMLKWLVEHRGESFSRSIFKNNDELRPEIYKFILEKRADLFHPNLIINAARCNDLETLKQLYERNGEHWRNYFGTTENGTRFNYMDKAFLEAGKHNRIQVVLWFMEMKLIV